MKKTNSPKGFIPEILNKMYEEYIETKKGKEKVESLEKGTVVVKQCPFLIPLKAGKCSVPISGIAILKSIERRGCELTLISKNGVGKVTIVCICTSWKPKEFVKGGFENEMWKLEVSTKFGINSSSEIGYENTQFKKITPSENKKRWEEGLIFTSFIVSDFAEDYLS